MAGAEVLGAAEEDDAVALGNGLGFGDESSVQPETANVTPTATAAIPCNRRLCDTPRPPRTSTRATFGQTGHGPFVNLTAQARIAEGPAADLWTRVFAFGPAPACEDARHGADG